MHFLTERKTIVKRGFLLIGLGNKKTKKERIVNLKVMYQFLENN